MSGELLVHVIDDDEAVRDSLEWVFETAEIAVRSYESALAFLEALGPAPSGCVVTDVRMPGMSGLDLLQTLQDRGVQIPVIVITGHGDIPLAVEAMRAGAQDFLEKPFEEARLLASVQRAFERGSGRPLSKEQADAHARIARLSQRERQVLKRLVDGQANKTVAWELGISARTVEVYRAKLMEKMQAAAFADLVRIALQAGDLDA
jgi:two-component system response regulator FixJ